MGGFDDLFKPFDDIIEEVEPSQDEPEEVWGKPDSWNSGKKQDIWNNNDGWNVEDTQNEDKKDDRNVFRHEPKEDLEWDEQDDEDDFDDLGIDDGF